MDNLEFYNVLSKVATFCDSNLAKNQIKNEKVVFSYLKIKRNLRQLQDALIFLEQGKQISLVNFQDCSMQIEKLKKQQRLTIQDLLLIGQQLKLVLFVKNNIQNLELETFSDFNYRLDSCLNIIDLLDSHLQDNATIKETASELLKNLTIKIQGLQNEINDNLRNFITNHEEIMMDKIIVERNNRFCVLISESYKNRYPGIFHGQSASGLAVYFEPKSVIQKNNDLSNLISQKKQEIERILDYLSSQIATIIVPLKSNQDSLLELDMILGKARYTRDFDGVVANVDKNYHGFYLENIANPLIDRKVVVRNTYYLADQKRGIVISGSNTGGKSVSLKTIGLSLCMSYLGIGLDCSSATFTFYDNLFVDIGDQQSIQQSLSTFSSHISRLVQFCQKVTNKSLLLLDEIGTGSNPKDASALAIGFIDYFLNKGAHLLVTTHYEDIKEYAKTEKRLDVASVYFDVDKLKPTYQFVLHQSGQSHAFFIAKRLGVIQDILDKAKYVLKNQDQTKEVLLQKLDEEFKLLETKKQQFIQQRKASEQEYDQKLKSLEIEKEKMHRKYLQLEANVVQELEDLKNLASKPNIDNTHIQARKRNLEKLAQPKPTNEFEIGDYVKIENLGYSGEIVSIGSKKAIVNVHGTKMQVELTKLINQAKPKKVKPKNTLKKEIAKKIALELNVIGDYGDEALAKVDKYLDNALIANVNQVTIIHGVGSGALRKKIHSYLQKHRYVNSFELINLGSTRVSLGK